MNSDKIYDILNKFVINNQRGILIDGAWGIGKTYQINLFLEKIRKSNKNKRNIKTKVIYSSLFGLQSINDLHTELYTKMHPGLNVLKHFTNTISPAFSLIPYAGDTISNGVSYAIGKIDDNISKPKNRLKEKDVNNNRSIIILDDIERVNENFNYSLLLGYINQLYLSGLKVVCICDSSKIKDEKFDDFKEKIFDRYYKVEKASKDVIKMYFNENLNIIDDDLILLFNNNLRIASKTALFYQEVKNHINLLDDKKYIKINERILIWYISLLVSGINAQILSKDYKRKQNNSDTTFENFNESFRDEKIADRLNYLYQQTQEKASLFKIQVKESVSKIMLIKSLAFAYLYDDYDYIDELLKKIDSSDIDEIDFFYLSSNDRLDAIEKFIKKSSSTSTPLTEKELRRIISMYEYDEISNANYNENDYISAISKRMIKSNDNVINQLNFIEMHSIKKVCDFISKLKDEYYSEIIEIEINKLKEFFEKKEFNKITESLNTINKKTCFHDKTKNNDLIKEIKDLFKENDFFFPELKGTICEKEWSFANEICGFISNYQFIVELKMFLTDKCKNSIDKDEKTRLGYLIKKY